MLLKGVTIDTLNSRPACKGLKGMNYRVGLSIDRQSPSVSDGQQRAATHGMTSSVGLVAG